MFIITNSVSIDRKEREKNITSSVACINNFQCGLNCKQISSLSDFKLLIPSRISTSLRGCHKKKGSVLSTRKNRKGKEGRRKKKKRKWKLVTNYLNFTFSQQCLVYKCFRENTFINVFLKHDLFFLTCHYMY